MTSAFFAAYKKAEIPARKMNTGAQKCVIQRVKKSQGVVAARSVGEEYQVPSPKYMRTWSSAMMTMTMPRSKSMESTLLVVKLVWKEVDLKRMCCR